MRKVLAFSVVPVVLLLTQLGLALDRQPNADYRRPAASLGWQEPAEARFCCSHPTKLRVQTQFMDTVQTTISFIFPAGPNQAQLLLIAPAIEAKGKDPARAYTEILFLPAHNYVQEKWTGPKLGPENPQAASITGFDHVEVLDSMREELVRLLPQAATIYTDVPAAGESIQFPGPTGMAEPRQCISFASFFPGCSAAAGLAAHVQRCGRNGSHPQSG